MKFQRNSGRALLSNINIFRNVARDQAMNKIGLLDNMETNMAMMPFKPLAKVFSASLLCLAAFAAPVHAQDFLCDATQASTQDLPLLDKSCPIGKGLWGKQQPKAQQSNFWIQCGVFAKPLTVKEAKVIYPKISTDVWAKIEGRNARCLIGPYSDFSEAKQDLAKVKTIARYKEAFIREVAKGAPTKPRQAVAKAPVVTKPKVAESKQAATVIVPPKVVKPVAPVPVTAPTKSTQAASEISVRREAIIGDVQFKVPYIMFSDDQFYMEYGLPWNRFDYDGAAQVCRQLGMGLPTEEQWQLLLEANIMKANQWPMHLPYWGDKRRGLFTNGKVTQIKGSSLLNIMCTK